MNLWIDSAYGPSNESWIWLKDYDVARQFIDCALDPCNGYPLIRTISLSVDMDVEFGLEFIAMLEYRHIGSSFNYHLHQSIPNGKLHQYTLIKDCITSHQWQIVE